MHRLIVLALLSASFASTAYAKSVPVTAQAGAYTTASTSLGALLKDPAAKAIIDKHIPGMTGQRMLFMVKRKTLKEIQAISKGGITDQQLAAIDADLAKLPVSR